MYDPDGTEQAEEVDNSDWIDVNAYESFRVPSSGACVSFNSALPTLHYYCATLPSDGTFTTRKAEFVSVSLAGTNVFQCEAKLPKQAALRTVVGKEMPSMTLAERSAALEAIKRLYEIGALDDHLLPCLDDDKDDIMKHNHDFFNLLDGMGIDPEDVPNNEAAHTDVSWTLQLPWSADKWEPIDVGGHVVFKHVLRLSDEFVGY